MHHGEKIVSGIGHEQDMDEHDSRYNQEKRHAENQHGQLEAESGGPGARYAVVQAVVGADVEQPAECFFLDFVRRVQEKSSAQEHGECACGHHVQKLDGCMVELDRFVFHNHEKERPAASEDYGKHDCRRN